MSEYESENDEEYMTESSNDTPSQCQVDFEDNNPKRKLTTATSLQKHVKKQKIDGTEETVCNYCGEIIEGGNLDETELLEQCTCAQNGGDTHGEPNFNLEVAIKEQAKMTILHEYPLSTAEHDGFRKYSKAIQPSFEPMSKSMIRNEIFKIYKAERIKSSSFVLTRQNRIAYTVDKWTSADQNTRYMAITSHFIDESWTLHRRLTRFVPMPFPYTRKTLSRALNGALLGLRCLPYITTFTVENDIDDRDLLLSEWSDARQILGGKLLYMRCFARVLNLIAEESLKAIGENINRIRHTVAYWVSSPEREKVYLSYKGKLALDCQTRWTSTYVMLATALKYKSFFSFLDNSVEFDYRSVLQEGDWELAEEICDRLKLFYNMSEMFSENKYPPIYGFFPKICKIKLSLPKWLSSSSDKIRKVASDMIQKFDEYWNDVHDMVVLATILDPRFKMRLIEYYFPQIYGEKSSSEIERVRKICQDLEKEYKSKAKSGEETRLSTKQNMTYPKSEVSTPGEYVDPLLDYDSFVSKIAAAKSELDYYFEEDPHSRTPDFDILAWWKTNATKCPTLSLIARDILAVPVSLVTSESAFDSNGRIVPLHRSKLNPTTLEALMCTRDWLMAETQGDYASIDEDEDIKEEPCRASLC